MVIGISWSDGSSSVVLALSWQMTATIRYTCPFEGTIEFMSFHARCQCPERGLQEQRFGFLCFCSYFCFRKERVLLRSFSQNIFHTTSYKMFWVRKTKTHGKMTDDFLFWGLPYPNCRKIPIIFWWSLVTYCLQTLVLTFRWIRDVSFTITKQLNLTTWQPVHVTRQAAQRVEVYQNHWMRWLGFHGMRYEIWDWQIDYRQI